jgi:putative FmdB family regulatory protein
MPLYEYECATCHKRTEKIQKFSDPEITICPHCGGPLERTITAPAFQFAGGGWYKDGYGNAKPAASSGDAPASDSKPAAPAAASGDSSAPAASAAPSTPATSTPAPAAPSTPAKS